MVSGLFGDLSLGGGPLTGPAAGDSISRSVAPVIAGIKTITESPISCECGVVAIDSGRATNNSGRGFCGRGCTVTSVGLLITLASSGVAVIGQCVPGVSGHVAAAGEVVTLGGDHTELAGIVLPLLLGFIQSLLHDTQVDVDGEEVVAAAARISLA